MALLLARVALQRYLPLAAMGTLQYPKGSMAEVCLPSFLQLLITSDYLLLLHTLHRAPLSLLAISWHLGGYSSVKRNRGLRCSPFTHKSYGVFWVLGAAPTRYGQPASPCVTIMLGGGWSASHVYRGGTCTVGPTCGIGRWWATVLITMIATVSNYCMNTILEVLNVSCA